VTPTYSLIRRLRALPSEKLAMDLFLNTLARQARLWLIMCVCTATTAFVLGWVVASK
jgi:hypothetical protein